MQEAETKTSTDPEPRCRLCLQWTDAVDTDRGLQNIFTEDDGGLPFKIQDCLGVLVSSKDSIQTICLNCRQMVHLIDEFRMLCRQTEEIYESVAIRCDDSERWERYGEYVGGLRKLVQEHRVTINEQLIGLDGVERTVEEDFISPQFVPMILMKEEPNDYDEVWSDEPMDMELLDIKQDRLPTDESDLEVDDKHKAELSDGTGSATSYEQRVKLAQEVLKRLKHFTCNALNHRELWEETAEQLGMDYSATTTRWDRMKNSYLVTKASVLTGNRLQILRLKNCTLFNLMNQIVPQLDENVQPWVAPESMAMDERNDGKSLPIGLKIAIAEEIKKSPDIWNTSLANSSHKIDHTWNIIAAKFKIDAKTLRLLWRSLQDMYEKHKKRVKAGVRVKTQADKNYYKLIEIVEHTYRTNDAAVVKQEQAMLVGENELRDVKEKKKADTSFSAQKMMLAKLVQQHPLIWNQKHHNFNNGVVKDAAWDEIAAVLNKTREETKYAWKCLREMYRCRIKRMQHGRVSLASRALQDPLFKQLDLICAENMRFRSISQPAASEDDAQNLSESESEEMQEDHGEDDLVEGESNRNMKLVVLCEHNEIIWNSKHPDHANLAMRDNAWDSIAKKMNQTRVQAKAMWSRLRNLYRARKIRFLKGNLPKNSHLLRGPLYRKLNKMLKGHMHLGKYGGGVTQTKLPKQAKKVSRADAERFLNMEDKVRLVEEVTKYEFLWNTTHPDYFKSEKRGAAWTRIAEIFDNCNVFAVKNEWRRLRDMHRPRKSRAAVNVSIEDNEEDEPTNNSPLYELFSKLAEKVSAGNEDVPAEEGESSGPKETKKGKKRRIQEITETYMTQKRRYTGKRIFDEEGCIKVMKGGTVRYEKICELCGKQIERSYFEYHMNQHYGLRPYVCSVEGCGRQYSNKITRDRHEVIVHCEQGYKYECDQCPEKFKNRSTFDYHYAIKHVSNQVPCNICGKLLKHKVLLREHLKRHTGNFSCNICGKVLQQKYSLDVHMRTHTNEKPYACEICGQSFMLKVQMKTHLTKIHQMKWEEFLATYGSAGQ